MAYRLPKITDAPPTLRLFQEEGQGSAAQELTSQEVRSLEPLLLAAALKKMTGSQSPSINPPRRRAGFAKPALAVALIMLLAVAAIVVGPQLLTDRFAIAETAAEQGGPAGGTTINGQQLVAESARRLLAESSIKANVRFRVNAFDHEVIGVGSYLQLGEGPEKLLRLELKSQVGDKTATLQEICSEDEYWIRRDVPQLHTTVGRASLRPIRQAIARKAKDPHIDPIETWLLLGGLPRLMEELSICFIYQNARASEVEFSAADGQGIERLPVWIVEGEWKPEPLNYLTNGKTPKDLSKLPAQIPSRVELILGRVDHAFPLFPYRITYLRPRSSSSSEGDDAAPSTGAMEPLCTLEFYGVFHTSEIDPREFAYDPGDQEVADLTQQFMQRLGLVGK
jgi:hypothetical protein